MNFFTLIFFNFYYLNGAVNSLPRENVPFLFSSVW